jgi:hypothetical protein
MLTGLATEIAVVFALIYTPGLNRLFEMEGVPLTWLLLLPLGAALFVALDAMRRAGAAWALRVCGSAGRRLTQPSS